MARPAITVRRPVDTRELDESSWTRFKASTIDDTIIPGIFNGDALNNPMVYGGRSSGRHRRPSRDHRRGGNELVVGDFKNIESVVTPWLAARRRCSTRSSTVRQPKR